MLRSRSWSLPPSFGLRQRDASPVGHRRHRRSRSFSWREMDKGMSMLDRYEEQHMRRQLKLRAYGVKLTTFLNTKTEVLDNLEARFKKLMADPLLDTEGLLSRGEEMFKKMAEELSCEREDVVVKALLWMQDKEDEFLKKLEIIRTMQMLSIRRKSANQY